MVRRWKPVRAFWNLLGKGRLEREMDDELRFHLDRQIEANLRSGMSQDEARRRALLDLGGGEQVRQRVREARAGFRLEALAKDLRFGGRMLRRHPGFTAVAVFTLALGIGACTAIFTLVETVLLRPLPYPEPDRLVLFLQSYPSAGLDRWGLSQFLFASFRDQSRSFERSAAYSSTGLNLAGREEPVRVQGAQVTWGYFEVLGVRPALGRTILPEEDVPGGSPVCLISDRLWRTRYHADLMIVGSSLRLDDVGRQVIGVMPPGFAAPRPDTDVWIPLGLDPSRRFGFWLTGIARLKPDVTVPGAGAEVTGLQWSLARQSESPPEPGADLGMLVMPLREALVGDTRRPLLVLSGAVGLVLLIACANTASLLLGRVTARRRELALRMALGASPGRIAAQLLTETFLLAALGASAGALVAVWLVALLGRMPLQGIPRVAELQVTMGALAFAAVLALPASALSGLLPALRARGLDAGLRGGARAGVGAGTRRLHHVLVGSQMALSITLLVGAGLLLRSFLTLLAVDPGFRPENLLTLRFSLSGERYGSTERMTLFYDELLRQVRDVPGVRSAGLISNLPIQSDGWSDGYAVEGHETPGAVQPNAMIRVALPGYFEAAGIPLRGRDFGPQDDAGAQRVAIVDETLARQYWPAGDAVGGRIRFGWDTSEQAWMTIVGVAGAVKHSGLEEAWYPHLYLPFRQSQETVSEMHLAVRTEADPGSSAAIIRARVAGLDPDLPLFAIRTMPELVSESLARQRLVYFLLASFAATALLMAAVGLYGVMSLSVSGRVQELGVRTALGADRGHLFRLVVGEGMRLAGLGVLAGVPAALAATRLLGSLLYEVSPADPLTLGAVVVVLGMAAFGACCLPALRAARVDPIVSLRCE
ncbi:MAG TPA: ABC transporter permease [Candidatus Polarisedimenticolia bacterium]|nr:ABC transporter permease [Candidatus Polarisedimenticolia bacterium]